MRRTNKRTPRQGAIWAKCARRPSLSEGEPAKKTPAKGGKKSVPAKAKAKAAKKAEGRMSQLDAAAKVLAEAAGPMSTKEMVEQMAAKGYWKSPGGKTPHATLYSSLLREHQKKAEQSRFKKVDRGRFTLA